MDLEGALIITYISLMLQGREEEIFLTEIPRRSWVIVTWAIVWKQDETENGFPLFTPAPHSINWLGFTAKAVGCGGGGCHSWRRGTSTLSRQAHTYPWGISPKKALLLLFKTNGGQFSFYSQKLLKWVIIEYSLISKVLHSLGQNFIPFTISVSNYAQEGTNEIPRQI